MRKLFQLTILLFFSTITFSQKIYYSNNIAYSSGFGYDIVGDVNGHIIIWKTYPERNFKSEIYVYDKFMQLIKTVKTNILKSDADPQCQFFLNQNIFLAAYQFKHENIFSYRLTSFDENGNIISTKTLDSINTNDKSLGGETVFYRIMQSENNGWICFIKMTDDAQHHVLKHDCSFIDNGIIVQKSFVIPFDEKNENLLDVATDTDKNILFLKEIKTGSGILLRLIRKNFTGEEMLTTDKTVSVNGFTTNSTHVFAKPDGYLVFGSTWQFIQTDTGNFLKPGLYIWQTDHSFNDIVKDAIIPEQHYENTQTYSASIVAGNMFSNVFATWSVRALPNKPDTIIKPQQANDQNSPIDPKYFFSSTHQSLRDGHTLPTGVFVPAGYATGELGLSRNALPSNTSIINTNEEAVLYPLKNEVELCKLNNNNEVVWQNVFNDKADTAARTNIVDAKIIAGNNSIHLIYQAVTEKNKTSVYNITVNADGSFSKNFFGDWDMRYEYKLDDCFLTSSNDLIIPAINGSKIRFGKLKLD